MQIKSESELLDQAKRKQIIDEIGAPENKARKDESFKRYEVYKDRTNKYVVERMLKMFDTTTVEEMSYAIANISLERKIIDKLARVYSQGVERSVMKDNDQVDVEMTKQVQDLAKILNMNTQMKRTNRAYKRDKNTLVYVKPYKCIENEKELYDLEVCPMFPFFYDVVEDPEQRTKPLCVILSHYTPPTFDSVSPIQNSNDAAIHGRNQITMQKAGNNIDEKIADIPTDQDAEKRQFIWWSKNYHFTTNEQGEIISEDTENPISDLPFVNFAEDQDGAFWAQGGDDLVDGSILVNSLISHMNHIAVTQGYGQFYMAGANLPSQQRIGPSKGIRMEFTKEDPTPQLGFLQANPPLEDLKANIEMYVAMLLTTNNLTVSGVATQLGNAATPAAGISLIIDKAESMEDVQDQQQIFHDNEGEIWELIAKWINLFKSKNLLVEDLSQFTLPEDLQVQLKFPDPRPIMSEKEKLDNLQLRKELGLNSQEELLMLDDPSLTKEQAKQKLKSIMEDKLNNMTQMMGDMNGGSAGQGNGQQGNQDQNNFDTGAGPVGSA
jgi:hypothetical protein